METRGQACGKVILLGEHAVVYGVPAIAVGIDRGARAVADPVEGGPSRLRVRGWNIAVRENEDGPRPGPRVPRAARRVARGPACDPPAVGRGRGRPSARGWPRLLGGHGRRHRARPRPAATDDALQERAMAWERVFHGNPSGIDAAVSARGGCVFFRKGEALERVRVRGTLHLCVGSTGIASSTKVDGRRRRAACARAGPRSWPRPSRASARSCSNARARHRGRRPSHARAS